MDPSQLAEAARRPSGAKATPCTLPLWPSSRFSAAPPATSHRIRVKSSEPVSARAPSGEKAAETTAASWPSRKRGAASPPGQSAAE
jgi:hypothetical protein